MANLIVTVIAIALVAVASLMGAYYGGSAFLQGSAKASAATLINQGSQISAAATLYRSGNDGAAYQDDVTMATALVGNDYLTAIDPPGGITGAGAWATTSRNQTGAVTECSAAATAAEVVVACLPITAADTGAKAVCKRVNTEAGHSDGNVNQAFTDGTTTARFGCAGDASSGGIDASTNLVMWYKL